MGGLSWTMDVMKLTIQVSNSMDLRVFVATLILFISFAGAFKVNFQCPSNDDISVQPHAQSCKKYYLCTFGQAEERTCPCTLNFDSVSRTCTHVDVQCVEGTEVDNQSVTASDVVMKMVPHPVICSKYYLCLGFITVERQCEQGLLFDAETNKCTYSGNARCYLNPWCPENDDLQDLRFFPDQENCARYLVCYNQIRHPLYCAEGLFFNLQTQECTLPGSSNCQVHGMHCTIDSKNVPHPSKCRSYYECNSGFAFYRECEDGYYFSELEVSCVPDNGECMQLPSSSSTELSSTEEMTTASVTEGSSTSTIGIVTTTESGGGEGGATSRLMNGINMTLLVAVFFLFAMV